MPRPSIKSRSSDSEVAAPSTSTRRAEAAPSGLSGCGTQQIPPSPPRGRRVGDEGAKTRLNQRPLVHFVLEMSDLRFHDCVQAGTPAVASQPG